MRSMYFNARLRARRRAGWVCFAIGRRLIVTTTALAPSDTRLCQLALLAAPMLAFAKPGWRDPSYEERRSERPS
jgi:hypothetical protein